MMLSQEKEKDMIQMDEKITMKDCCSSAEKLKEYLRQKALAHNSYKCYSQIERIRSIVQDKALYLNDGRGWNDITDRTNFRKDGKDRVNFGKCFSFSQDENVAMWMLYGGIHHMGAMVDFTRMGINNILKTSSIELGYFENGQFCSVETIERPDFEMWVTDIVYCNENTRYLKRSDETCTNVEQSVLDQLGAVRKAYPWNYENECRLIVSVHMNAVPEKCDTVKIDLSMIDLGKSLARAYYCPSYQGKQEEGFQESALNRTIDWDLRDKRCKACKVLEG